MADKTITERLQPSLLDRLTDDAPDTPSERPEDRVIDLRRLREIIQRDLSWLLNTNNKDTELDLTAYPNVATSVLNFGLREVAGVHSTESRTEEIRVAIRRAIERFEPRINRGSIDVELRKEGKGQEMKVSFDIRADMWAQPMPLELYLRSQVDTLTGELSLERKG